MLKKILLFLLLIGLLLAMIAGWRFLTSGTSFKEESKFLYIRTGHATPAEVMATLKDSNFIKNPDSFNLIANQLDVWKNIKPGRYEIKNGMSLYHIAKLLRTGRQTPVNLVITKLRTKENLAALVARKLECDSATMFKFLTNKDSLKQYGLDSNTVMTAVFPNTYTYFWNTTPSAIFKKLHDEYEEVWTTERKESAAQRGLTPITAYILASIVEEETNLKEDKGNIASVYLNRLEKRMHLGADPTVKYAMRNFVLKRIYHKHLDTESPYNTYRNLGLPPGPISTPSLETLDEVLHAPKTNYLFFVAKSDLSKKHVFTETYQEHLKYAKEYQVALDSFFRKKEATNQDTAQ